MAAKKTSRAVSESWPTRGWKGAVSRNASSTWTPGRMTRSSCSSSPSSRSRRSARSSSAIRRPPPVHLDDQCRREAGGWDPGSGGAELPLAGGHLLAEAGELLLAEDLLGLGQQLLFLLLDMVADVLHQDRHLGVEGVVLGRHGGQLAEQHLDHVVLLDGLGDQLLAVLAGRGLDGRVVGLLLDGRVDLELLDDLLHHALL